MATLQELRSDLNFAESELRKARENLAQAEADLANSRANPNLQDLIVSQSNNLERARGRLEQAENRVNALNTEIRSVQGQGPGTTSAGQTVAQAQRANDDRADTISPGADTGTTAQAPGPTNAERFEPPAAEETDPALRTTEQTQSLPPNTASPGGIPSQPRQDAFAFDDQQLITTTQQAGAGPAKDDTTGATLSGVRAALNERFAGNIVPQGNVLDQYASYTYSISIYLMNAGDYKQFIASNGTALPAGSQLILQSAGAATGGGIIPGAALDPNLEDPGQAAQAQRVNLGRNEFFSLDYYIDDVKIESVSSGKGIGQAHNATKLQFRVIEPNGITFLDNLYRATDQYVRLSGSPQTNYAAQHYLMAIRFYGYDKDGNLVLSQNQPFLDPISRKRIDTIVEKFIPFRIDSIKFRVANKIPEYDVECSAVRTSIAASSARGTIPYNVELTSQTLRDLLGGQAQFAKAPADGQGRPAATPAADPKARNPANAGFLNTNESGQGTDFTLGVSA